MSKKNSFTLVEIIITLTVIGIVSSLIIPVAMKSMPDENLMKFKKADNQLYNIINEFITSEKYFKNGDLGIKADGKLANKSYLCESFADIVGAKNKNCNYVLKNEPEGGNVAICVFNGAAGIHVYSDEEMGIEVDNYCLSAEKATSQKIIGVQTKDNILFFEENLFNFFGCTYDNTGEKCGHSTGLKYGRMYNANDDIVNCTIGITTNRFYRIFCIDVDGINKGEDPFGYGIRVDGKILRGKKANDWIKKESK